MKLKRAGVAKARDVINAADLVIHVIDATEKDGFDTEVSENRARLVVVNKVDLCQKPLSPNSNCPIVFLSAKTGEGMDELLAAISNALVPIVPDDDQLVPVTEAHRKLLQG